MMNVFCLKPFETNVGTYQHLIFDIAKCYVLIIK